MMYSIINCATPDIMLWCDGHSESNETPNSKRQKTDDTLIFLSMKRKKTISSGIEGTKWEHIGTIRSTVLFMGSHDFYWSPHQ